MLQNWMVVPHSKGLTEPVCVCLRGDCCLLPHSGAPGGGLVLIGKAKNKRQWLAAPSTALQDGGTLRWKLLQKEQEERSMPLTCGWTLE